MAKEQIAKFIAAFLIFFSASIYLTYPLIFHMGDMVTGLGDELFIAMTQNWVIHVITSGNISSLFETNIYFPYHNTLAYSETFISSSILALPIRQILGEPIATVNFTIVSSLILLGFSIYLLCFYLTKDFFASLLSGMLVVFSPAVLDKVVHIQMLAIQWVPLAILFFFKFIRSKKSRYLSISLFFFLLQTYNCFMAGYFILFSYIIIFIFSRIYEKKDLKKLIKKKNIFLFLLAFIFIIPIIMPYFSVSKEFHYVRDVRDAIHFALQPEDFLYPSDKTRLNSLLASLPFNQHSQNGEFKPGYLGFVFTFLVVFVLVYVLKKFRKKNLYIHSFTLIAFLGLILSLGPVLHLGRQTIHHPFPIPLPYLLFYYVIPGFQGFRNSARWEMLFILAIAIVIALVLHKILKKYSSRKRITIYLLLILLTIVEFNFPMHFQKAPQVKEFPPVYSWLSTTPKDKSIIELPIYNWNMWPGTENELLREYYGTLHFRKMVNGYSGFSPPPWQEMVYETDASFPSQKTLEKLKMMRINYIIVHKSEFDKLNKDNFKVNNHLFEKGDVVIAQLSKNKEVKLIKQFGGDFVFEFVNVKKQ
jgi:hypothetical protein